MIEEKKIILEMLKDGKITIDEAEKLLDKIHLDKTISYENINNSTNKKFLKVFIIEGDNTKVNINVPIALAEVALKLIPKNQLKINGIELDVDQILDSINNNLNNELINVDTINEKGQQVKVKIFVD